MIDKEAPRGKRHHEAGRKRSPAQTDASRAKASDGEHSAPTRKQRPRSNRDGVPTRGSRTREATRQKLINAALNVIAKKGVDSTAIADITETADVGFGSFYNHFKSKEALATEILIAYGKGSTDRSILTNPEVPAITRLRKHFAALNEYFTRCTDGCLVGKFMAEVSDDTPQIRKGLRSVLKLWGQQIASTIADGQKQGSIRKDLVPDELAAFLIDAYEGAVLRTRLEHTSKALHFFVKVIFSSITV